MNAKLYKKYREDAEFLKAMAHPTRLLIVNRLSSGPKCVANIEQLLGLKQSNVSQHLNILRRHKIVDYSIKGKSRCYYVVKPDYVKKLLKNISERS